jgi:hypothetical protein
MKKNVFLLLFTVIISGNLLSQSYPFTLYGPGLDGSMYQKFSLYADTQYGLLFEAPLDATGNRLPITYSWRGNSGTIPLCIKANGKVGIGLEPTNAILANLDIIGSNTITDSYGNLVIRTNTPQGTNVGGQITFGGKYNDNGYYAGLACIAGRKSSDVSGDGSSYLSFGTSDNTITITEKMRITAEGRVGIGTSQPSEMLHIKGTTSSEIRLESANGSAYIRQSGTNLNLYNNGERLTILDNGFIGIGTISPAYRLDVCGIIRAKEVKVDLLGGCDFVFKKEYKLMDLIELEKFVKANRHLPEIAPEKEMVENGVNMNELQMKLLQKIEELTLYTIEQNKKIEQQNEEIKALKGKMNKIEAIVK